MRNLWCLEKISILPLIISATGIVPQSLFKNLKILDLGNTLVVEIQKGILLYSCHIVRKFLNIDTEHNSTMADSGVDKGGSRGSGPPPELIHIFFTTE
jgi:hypothetical protein